MKSLRAEYSATLTRAQLERFKKRGAFVVVRHEGSSKESVGCMFTTPLLAVGDETPEECVKRHGFALQDDDLVLHYNLRLDFPEGAQ